MARKTKEEAQLTRIQLLEAAERLFSERGVSRTTLNDIATAAGVTRGAVYWHFQNKADLLQALWEHVALPLQESFDEIERTMADNPLGLIRAKAVSVLTKVVHDSGVRSLLSILLLKCEYVDEPGGMRDGYLSKRGECFSEISEKFRRAISCGQLPSGVNAEQAAVGLMAMIDGLSFHWLMNPSLFSLEDSAPVMIDAYLKGLAIPA